MTKFSKFRMEGEILYPNALILGQSPKAQKKIFGSHSGVYGLINEQKGYWHFYEKESVKKFGRIVLNKFIKDKKYYDEYLKTCFKFIDEFEELNRLYLSLNYNALSKKELSMYFKKICDYGIEQFNYLYPPSEAIGLVAYEFIQKQIELNKQEIPMDLLFFQNWKSYVVKEEENIFEIVEYIKKSTELKKLFEEKNNPTLLQIADIDAALSDYISSHTEIYWFAFSSYLTIKRADESFFINRIKEHMSLERSNVKEKIDKSKELVELGASEELIYLVKIIDNQAEIFDYRKTLNLRLLYFMMQLLDAYGNKINISGKDLMMLLPEELESVFNDELSYEEIKQKVENNFNSVQIFYEDKVETLYGTEAEEKKKVLLSEKEEFPLKGIPASSGKIKGKVRLIRALSDNTEFSKGEILVTTHTTPDWLSLMKKASAIVTERGGITSHSAIVSRELKIPCVVNVENVVNMLEDGDLIEVDAEKGLIHKL